MKRIFLFALCIVLASNTLLAGEIEYYNKPWEEIKAKARAEHKYIFIDCYTDWCGWCKVMDKETMTNPDIVSMMTENFIAVKMDMEHGEAIKLAMKYHVNMFPSFLFFSPEGAYVYQAAGYQKPEEFMKTMKLALDGATQIKAPGFSPSLSVSYPAIYANAFAENGKKTFPKTPEVEAYLGTQKDLTSEVSWAVIARFDAGEKYTQYFLNNVDKYRKLYGSVSVNGKLNSVLGKLLTKATENKDDKAFEALLQMIDKYMGDDAASSKIYCSIAFYKDTKNWKKYAVAAKDYIAKMGYDNTSYINTFCWDIYEHCDDKNIVQSSCAWMQEVTNKEPTYPYLDTYAALLYKAGQYRDAKMVAERAIETGKKAGADVKATEELLVKINTGK